MLCRLTPAFISGSGTQRLNGKTVPSNWHEKHLFSSIGVKKGDRVSIYMPMIIELVVAMLACARIGALHSIVVRRCNYFWYELYFCMVADLKAADSSLNEPGGDPLLPCIAFW